MTTDTNHPEASASASKICTVCKTDKPLSEYHRNRYMGDGRLSRCKECQRTAMREHQRANPEANRKRAVEWNREHPEQVRDRYLRKRYGISNEVYADVLARQGGACFICRMPAHQSKRSLCIDTHADGTVRALLCWPCKGASVLVSGAEHLRKIAAYMDGEV
jgi:hypothetical protein